jgi:hypothetical protein
MTAASVQLLYAPDMQISGLRTAETVILVTLRLRALRWREPALDHPDWRKGLQAGNLPSWAIAAFDELFQIVAMRRRHALDVRGLHCSQLGFDEGQFLRTLSLSQRGRSGQVEAVLKDWLSAAALKIAAYPAASLACALQRADLVISPRDKATAVTEPQFRANPHLSLPH